MGGEVASHREVAELDRQVERGSLFTQATLERAFRRLGHAEQLLGRVIERLAATGVVTEEELGVRLEDPEDAYEGGDGGEGGEGTPPAAIGWPTIALRIDPKDPAERPEREVDCAARMPVCQAVCCRLKFPLSPPEVEAGTVRWDIGHPYVIRQGSNGYCIHNDAATRECGVYADRPGTCRRYSCAGDTRIWSDFDAMVLNQEWIDAHLSAHDLRVHAVLPAMEVPVTVGTKPAVVARS